jgi:hypothetical protein
MRPASTSARLLASLGVLVVTTLVLTGANAATAQGDVVYTTEFADLTDASVEWGFESSATTETGNGYSLELVPGALNVRVTTLSNFWISPEIGAIPDDQVVEATIADASGDDSVTAGVVCRGSLEDDLGYVFLIGTDGFYTIGDASGAARALVNKKGTKRSDAIDPAGPNTVRAECVDVGSSGVRLTMFVNDEKVASVVDRSASEVGPEAWLVTEVDRSRQADVSFSSFTIAAA